MRLTADGQVRNCLFAREESDLRTALRAGASGYMLKHAAPAGLADAVRTVADGGSWIDPSVAGKVIDTLRQTTPIDATGHPSLEILSRRELEVLSLMRDAPTNSELARLLFVSESTVKANLTRIMAKLEVRDRVQLIIRAAQLRLVTLALD